MVPPHQIPQQVTHGNSSVLIKVDQLREIIGKSVALPQVIVGGDQSSGKSSVLENLTGFAFPRAAELCTRYATQITCRRDESESITVSIIPSHDAPPDVQARLRKFHRTFIQLDSKTLTNVFTSANEAMGIVSSNPASEIEALSLPAFSEHILKIEKVGPNEEHFTVIDVPGIFRKETEGVTTESDIALVMNMVKKYMKNPRTIILAIMPSNVDLATQEILKLAKEADPSMTRTMAVFTKPDLAIERSTQNIVIDHVLGKRNDLSLGYYIVKNRGPDDANKTLAEGQISEREFFTQDPWSTLQETGRAGIECLKYRVKDLLIDLIKQEFPKLKSEVSGKLRTLNDDYSKMGPSRNSPDTQRQYLCKLVERFQFLVRDALNASYDHDKMFDNFHLRLMTQIVDTSEAYQKIIEEYGYTRPFMTNTDTNHQSSAKKNSAPRMKDKRRAFEVFPSKFLFKDIQELFDIPMNPTLKDDTATDILTYIENLYKWDFITMDFMKVFLNHVHRFILNALERSCSDPKVVQALWNGHLQEEVLKGYREAVSCAKFLLEVERKCPPFTLNHYFNDNLQKAQGERLANALEELGIANTSKTSGEILDKDVIHIKKSSIENLSVNKANSAHVRDYMHDVLQSYYKVVLKRFVDNVVQQAVHWHLLSEDHGPLSAFSTDVIFRLGEDELATIAGESLQVQLHREKLSRDIANFEAALKVLKGSG
ncbi:P-loop containing nucleoside triphosphate hydrolase protein [Xylariaceae sp. FL0255]|nr:P-loop containing nucleoside triphosphate hydrolase protein [Xylariaceae sp. FL0255]